MKNLFYIIVISLFNNYLLSEQYYIFEESISEYNEIQNEIIIENPDYENDKLSFLSFDGETINFFGDDFTFGDKVFFAIQTYGNLRIDNETSVIIIDGIFSELNSIDVNSKISWTIKEIEEEEVFIAQWKNINIVNGPENNFVNFQIWVYKKTGKIQLRYGKSSENNSFGYNDEVGPYAGMFYSINSFTKMYEKIWLYGEPENIKVDSIQNYSFKRLYGIPKEGTVYSFIPKELKNPSDVEQNNSDSGLIISPNPVDDYIYFDIDNVEIVEIKIYNLDGKEVLSQNGISNNKIMVSNFAKGSYIMNVLTKNGIYSEKFIKN